MTKIVNHPEAALVADYALGRLDDITGLLVAAHVDLCPHCQQQVAAIEAREATLWLADGEPDGGADATLNAMLTTILSSAPDATPTKPQPLPLQPIVVGERRFELPRALQRFAPQVKPWRRFGSKIWQSRLEFGDRHLQLLFMDKEGRVPQHTHKGQEITLVLHGGFEDENGEYRAGDFMVRDGRHRHTPVASHEACLCIALSEGPLHFTSGLGRLLNPFVHWLG